MIAQSPLRITSVGAVVVLVLFASLRFAEAQPATAVGTVAELIGHVTLTRSGTTLDVSLGSELRTNDTLSTAPSSSVVITLADQSRLQLGESTTVSLSQMAASQSQATRLALLKGRLRSIVKAASAGLNNKFEVHTTNAVVGVRGTDFATGYSAGETREGYGDITSFTDVATYKGTVEVSNLTAPLASVLVEEGYETTVAGDRSPDQPGPLGLTGIWSMPEQPGSVIAPAPPSSAPVQQPPPSIRPQG